MNNIEDSVRGSGFGVSGLGFRVQGRRGHGSWFRVEGLEFGFVVEDLGSRVYGSWCRIFGAWCIVEVFFTQRHTRSQRGDRSQLATSCPPGTPDMTHFEASRRCLRCTGCMCLFANGERIH